MNYQALLERKAEIERLHAEVEKRLRASRQAEVQEVIKKIKTLMSAYGITTDDLEKKISPKTDKREKVQAKYRDPSTGQTWSGRGIMPKWMQAAVKNGMSRDQFLI